MMTMIERGDFYSEEEIAMLREQLAEANKRALEAVRKRGAKIHPRVAALTDKPKGK